MNELLDDLADTEARKALDGGFEFGDVAEGLRVHSTPATRDRYQVIRSRKLGEVWEEGDRLYRMGPGGVTVFNFSRWSNG